MAKTDKIAPSSVVEIFPVVEMLPEIFADEVVEMLPLRLADEVVEIFPARAVEDIAKIKSDVQRIDWMRFIGLSPSEPNVYWVGCLHGVCDLAKLAPCAGDR